MDRKQTSKTNSSHHSFDMSEYIFGERFELGGVDFDLDDTQEEKIKKPKKDEAKSPRVRTPEVRD